MSGEEKGKTGRFEWDKVKKGESYIRRVRNRETGEWEEREVIITGKRENPTLDESEGARIVSVQTKRERTVEGGKKEG